jgi:hypothetical protein
LTFDSLFYLPNSNICARIREGKSTAIKRENMSQAATQADLEISQVLARQLNEAIKDYQPLDPEHITLEALFEAYELVKTLRNKSNNKATKSRCNKIANIISIIVMKSDQRIFFEMTSSDPNEDAELKGIFNNNSRSTIVGMLIKSLENPTNNCFSRAVLSVRLDGDLDRYMCIPYTSIQPAFAVQLIKRANFIVPAYQHNGSEEAKFLPQDSTMLGNLEDAVTSAFGQKASTLLKTRK